MRHSSGSTRIVSRGVVTRMPLDCVIPPAVVRNRCDELMPLFRHERRKWDALHTDETAGWRYQPPVFDEGRAA